MTPEQHRNQAALLLLSDTEEAHRRANLHEKIAAAIEERAARARMAGDALFNDPDLDTAYWVSETSHHRHDPIEIRIQNQERAGSRSPWSEPEEGEEAETGIGEGGGDAGTWNEADHPRGQPGNAGQFGSGGGGRDPAAEGRAAVEEEDRQRDAARAATAAPARAASRGAYAGQYETSGGSPQANHLLTVSRVLSNPPNRGIHYRRMLAQLIREAPKLSDGSQVAALRSKLISALVASNNAFIAAGRTQEAARVLQTLTRLGQQMDRERGAARPPTPAPAAPAPAPTPRAPPRQTLTERLQRELTAAQGGPVAAPVPRSGSLSQNLTDNYRANPLAVRTFEQHVKMSPDEFFKAVTGPMFDKTAARTIVASPYQGAGTLEVRGSFPGGGSISRNFDFANKTVDHSYLVIPDDYRKAGKAILASQMALYQKLGMEKVTVHANIDVGAYAWAKYGFVPNQSSWNDLRTNLIKRLESVEKRATAEGQGGEEGLAKLKKDVAAMKAIARNSDPKSIWKFVDHPGTVQLSGKPTSVAKALMTGGGAPHWYGDLNMKDKATMDRFNGYVSKGS